MTTILEGAQKMQRGESPPPPIGRLLGLVLKVIEPGRAVIEMEADERHQNPMGTLHGGVIAIWPMRRWATPTQLRWVRARRSRPSS